ncbi:hypothetical protein EYZ11_000996 [Aspergillus tanneri]|uniref:Uncharacterized protein n=1 Tax=Aspergillus tanneri TaxID=1220188 RepID=A0A4S3JVR9_9EURO|nr:hypothetical protein EYZ11_000996 [Aspergillus tanneri]
MSQPVLTDSRIVMAEQSSHDVVNQTLSGGDPSPSDVPASTNDKQPAGGDVGEIKHTATTIETETTSSTTQGERRSDPDLSVQKNEPGTDTERLSTEISRHGPGPVPTRVLEMNGVASASDGGEDTASLGGSESDASRTDSKLNSRASSTKRPTSFKPVTFAKFSVPKAPGTPPTAKVPDKDDSPLIFVNSARPTTAKFTTSLGRQDDYGPDPNQVWNRNQPAQQTPPKHLTDEELKQQYGIHMTSRIQEDGGGTEAKWADIDDDEDDWAPETIEWTDGTKTNLTHPEPAPVSATEHQAPTENRDEPLPPEQVATAKDALRFVPKPTTSIGPNPTVLRLGANAERQAKNASILSRGPNERFPSLSTSPAPPPTKSPWAPLPPVEKISPVIPPVQPQQQFVRPSTREQPSQVAMSPYPKPGKETGVLSKACVPRLCFKGQPRVSQRALQSLPQLSKLIEQVLRMALIGPGVEHRRIPDVAQRSFETRRGSQVNGMVESPLISRDLPPPKEPLPETAPSQPGHGLPRSPRGSAATVHDRVLASSSATAHPPEPHVGEETAASRVPQEDPVAMQQRIMKEKRMEARQRRLEQEEKEEAAKRERIRQKLEALGPPPEKAKPRRKESLESNKAESNASPSTAQITHSPPKPPVPEPTGEPKQYGMMKVHHPDNVKKFIGKDRAADKGAPMATTRRIPSPVHEPKADTTVTNGLQSPGDSQAHLPESFPDSKLEEQGPQWRSGLNAPSSYSPWAPNNKLVTTPAMTNPWKPLSSDKTLGNGIFDQGLGGFPARDISLRGHLGLDQSSVTPVSQPFSAPSRSPQESASISPLPSPEVRHTSYEPINPIARPGPIGPPSSQHPWQHENRVAGTAAWNNFHAVAAKREAEENEKLRGEMNAIREAPSSLPVAFNETWRQVRTGDQAGRRQVVGISRSTENNNTAPMSSPLPGLDHPVSTLPFAESSARPFGSVAVRSSRFFPQVPIEHPKKPVFEGDDFRRPSPPPPEDMSNHPVYTGDMNKPLVHLPAPKPIVKLPPKVVTTSQHPPTFASMVAASPRSAPVSTAASWQEKINCLFGKKTVPEKKNALAVTSASKEPLDVQLHIAAVSVLLPQNDEFPTGDGDITARQVEEAEEMFEDREVHSIEPFSFGFHDKDTSGNQRVSIRFPGAVLAKTIVLSKRSGNQNPLRPRGSSSYKPRKNTKLREGAGSSSSKRSASSQHGTGNSSPRHQSRNGSWGPRTFSGSR